MDTGIATINEQVKEASAFAYRLREQIGTVIVGQRYLVDRLLVGLLTGGHILLEGVPGLAKTLSVKTLAALPYGERCCTRTASSTSFVRMITITGPKTSSWAMRISGVT